MEVFKTIISYLWVGIKNLPSIAVGIYNVILILPKVIDFINEMSKKAKDAATKKLQDKLNKKADSAAEKLHSDDIKTKLEGAKENEDFYNSIK